ncbi:MAG: Gfo/Idh/MocA family oxidoreductase [Bellilinea sp.]|jgi:predicted dehydrogenase
MKFLIAGYGSIGRRHLRNLIALGERDVLLYRTRRSTLPTDEIADLVTETDLEAALARRPDAVIIANPTALHLAVAIPAARQGCHILMEKPLSHSMDGIAELERALEQGGGRLLMGYQFRFHPTLRRAAGVIASGEIGRPVAARVHWGEYLPDWHPWEDYRQSYAARPDLGGGVVLTLCHPLDYLRMMLGEVSAVSAMTAALPELELNLDAAADILLRFENDAIASLHLNYIQQPAQHTLQVIGTQGSLYWDNASGCLNWQRAGETGFHTVQPDADFERNWMFMEQMRHFIAVARGEAQPVCTVQDGARALRLALAALESAANGCQARV